MYKESLKIYLIRLKNTLLYKSLLNNYFLVVINITLLLLSFNYLYFLPILILFDYNLYKKSKEIFKVSLLFLLIIVVNLTFLRITTSYNNKEEKIDIEGYLYDVEVNETYTKIIIKHGITKSIGIIDKIDSNLKIGNKIKITGTIQKISGNHNENEFNYLEYLKHNKYDSYVKVQKIEKLNNFISLGILKTYIDNYLSSITKEASTFIKALLFAESSNLNEDFYTSLRKNGTIHLFAVSGLHISLFLGFFDKIYQKLKIKEKLTYIINIIFLIIYLVITDFTPSILRVSLSYVIKIISNKFFKPINLSSLDIQSISFIILIMLNPYYMYSLGFILSYIASFTIILANKLVSNKNELIQTLILSVYTMITSFPLVINMSYEINLLIPIINVLFISIVSYIILPLTIVVFILPFLSNIYYYIILSFQKFSIFVSNYINISVNFPKFSIIAIVIYYLLVIYIFKYYKKLKEKVMFNYRWVYLLIILILFSFFITTKNGFFCNNQMYFLDLENGESTVIVEESKVIVIDTGTGENCAVTNFLKSKGIKKIDVLILTHNHDDHNGEAKALIENFKVTNIIISAYDDSVINNNYQCIKVVSGDIINICGYNIEILNPSKPHLDKNDDSLVFILEVFSKKILFVGDLTIAGEKEILNRLSDVDILKVGHHGSKTSTSPELINKVKPEVAIIMAGRVKKFGFPHQETIDILNSYNIKTYRTDQDNMITYKNGKFYKLAKWVPLVH